MQIGSWTPWVGLVLVLAVPGPVHGQRFWRVEAAPHDAVTQWQRSGVGVIGRTGDGALVLDRAGVSDSAWDQIQSRWNPQAWERSERLRIGAARQQSQTSQRWVLVAPPGADLDHLSDTLAKRYPDLSVVVSHPGARLPRMVVAGPGARLSAAAHSMLAAELVLWAEPHTPLSFLNTATVEPMQANASTGMTPPVLTPIWNQDLMGSGQIIAIADSGLDRNEDWFTEYDDGTGVVEALTDAEDTQPPAPGSLFPDRKVVAYWVSPGAVAYDTAGAGFHGTHVTGTAAGDRGVPSNPTDINYTLADGMAPQARILFQDLGANTNQLPGLAGAPIWQQARSGGAFVHSNSYGSLPANLADDLYTSGDAEADDFLWRHEDMLIVVAAGNAGDPNTIHHPGAAKHVLTVGALNHGDSTLQANLSSEGPTVDGRMKPDLMAPGIGVFSAQGNNDNDGFDSSAVSARNGTSMATPAVAAGGLMARQYFMEGFYPTGTRSLSDARTPSGALLKSLLIMGAERGLTPAAPSNATGWGRIWLDESLYFAGDGNGLRVWDLPNRAGLEAGQVHEYDLEVTDDNDPLRVALAWYDPAPLGGGPALVNNLDLEVEGPAGASVLYRGNVFSGSQSTSGGTADTLNPVEVVHLNAPALGAYTVRVRASSVPGTGDPASLKQGYGLSASAATCATGATVPPTFTLSSAPGGITLDFGASGDYTVYRTLGDCNVDPATAVFVGQARASDSFIDTATQGGFSYAYRARGADGCGEGPISACATAISQAACTLAPDFDAEQATLSGSGGDACAATVDWPAGLATCPGATALNYQVFRSTDPFFDPESEAPLATQATTQLLDLTPVPSVTHYYRVRAMDDLGNVSSVSPLLRYPAVASTRSPGTFVDGGEALALLEPEPPWQLTATQAASGTRSYLSAADGVAYPPSRCAALTTPPIDLQAGSPALSFQARYTLEADFDGVVMEISTNGGGVWQDLAPDGGYPGDFSQTGTTPANACGYAASQGAFNGDSGGVFQPFTADLSAFAGQTVQLRWRFSSDPGVELEGFFLDQIQITAASVPDPCLSSELIFADGYEG